MSTNFKSPGRNLTVIAPADTLSGAFLLIGAAIFGVAIASALSGKPLVIATDGEYTGVPKATGAAWVVGDILYWDATAKNFTKTATNNTRVGVATVAAATGDAVGTIKLNGVVL
jgi:predicted RecA/RadA family phage recombinase